MVKGIVLVMTVDFVEKEFGEAAKAEWLAALSEDDRHSFEYPMATSWYPLDLFWSGGMAACERFAADRLPEVTRRWGAHGARMQLTGIYRLLLKLGSPNMMLSSAPRMWGTFNSEGTILAIRNEKGCGIVRLEDFSLKAPLFGEQMAGWMGEAILLSGKRDVQVAVTQTPSSGNDYFEFELTWTP